MGVEEGQELFGMLWVDDAAEARPQTVWMLTVIYEGLKTPSGG